MKTGIACYVSHAQKDESILEGNNIKLVSNSGALIHQTQKFKTKDIREFWDVTLCLKRKN